ncbi:hypothetical protein OG738_14325 [Amycolatopsis sp. NBC_01488]|uniref:hypothetical protein n=1 Tax=Amycolatopsis sp. NBC_01488 TaxID=2903563 RepID=UPI002E27DD1C|nr:hypothetical protein [Amycolatopsis sp. NBC_01488]
MAEQVPPEGVGGRGLAVREAILAAAELISDVPIPRSATVAEQGCGSSLGAGERWRHG